MGNDHSKNRICRKCYSRVLQLRQGGRVIPEDGIQVSSPGCLSCLRVDLKRKEDKFQESVGSYDPGCYPEIYASYERFLKCSRRFQEALLNLKLSRMECFRSYGIPYNRAVKELNLLIQTEQDLIQKEIHMAKIKQEESAQKAHHMAAILSLETRFRLLTEDLIAHHEDIHVQYMVFLEYSKKLRQALATPYLSLDDCAQLHGQEYEEAGRLLEDSIQQLKKTVDVDVELF